MNAAKREVFEIWVGAGIAVGLIVFVSLILGPARFEDGRYDVTAQFSSADGLSVGGLVRAAGVPVGEIKELHLDENFRAVAVLRIDDSVELDAEASASIVTDGLFGAKFIQLDVGASDLRIRDGGQIAFTEDSLILDDLLELIISQAKKAKQARREAGGAATEDRP